MTDPRIQLKNPIMAGCLAFLVPGLGHWYQGRIFKAVVFGICIWGMFLTGMAMAEWKALQPLKVNQLPRGGLTTLKFLAQMGVGLPSLLGIAQAHRVESDANLKSQQISSTFAGDFTGTADLYDEQSGNLQGPVEGELRAETKPNEFHGESLQADFEGRFKDGNVKWTLSDDIDFAPAIGASSQRKVTARITTGDRTIGTLKGSVSRPFWNWLLCPLEPDETRDLHRRLGKYHELAMVFTWVAGLLNILAVFDAVEGPAYGFGEPQPVEEKKPEPAPEESAGVAS